MGRSIATLALLALALPLAACDGGGSGTPAAGKLDLSDTGLAQRISTLETRAASLEQRADGADSRIDLVEGTADAWSADLAIVETRTDATKAELLEGIDALEFHWLTAVKALEPLRIVRGSLDDDGLVLAGTGFSVDPLSFFLPGLYHITFDTPFAAPPTIVCSSTDDAVVSVIDRSETGFSVRVLRLYEDGEVFASQEFRPWDFSVIGYP